MQRNRVFWHARAGARLFFATAAIASLVACSHAASLAPAVPGQTGAHAPVQTPARNFGQITPNSTAQTHVLTVEYLFDFVPRFALPRIAPWTTWIVGTPAQSLVLHPLGVKTLMYTNPNRTGPGDPLYTNDESTFAHDCAGRRIGIAGWPGKKLMEPHSATLATMWQNLVGQIGNLGVFDGTIEDSADTPQAANSLPCNYNQADWTDATADMGRKVPAAIIYNGLGGLLFSRGIWTMSPAIDLNPSSMGGQMEGCYSSNGINPKPREKVWAVMEDTELRMVRENKIFFCRGLGLTDATRAADLRMYMTASFLLTYDPGTSVISEKFRTPSGFVIDPEVAFVPTAPVQPEPATVDALLLSGGSYGREYQRCYLGGASVGSCAIVVNSSRSANTAFPWPSKYHHTLVLHGGGALDGGTVTVTGGAPPNVVAPTTGIIAVR